MSKHRTRTTGWNRLLSGVLCLALALGLLPAAGLVQIAGAAHWADSYGEQLVEWGIMNPSPDLRLGDEITRAEFVAMCNRTFGYKKLGGTPFIDVPSSGWYAQDIDIAYNAGYFKGTSSDPENPKASPDDSLTREQAAVLLSRNMMLQETVGESLGFSDSRELSEWSRGLIGAAVEQGVVSGYSDGSFRPFDNITRGEVAAMLVRAVGTPINKEGSYELGSAYGNVTISSSNVTLRNTVILGNLYVTGGVDLGNVLLENVTVLGRIILSGGGESDAAKSSVVLRNVEADEMLVDSMIGQFVTVSAYGLTNIPLTYVRSDAYLEDSSSPGYGLDRIELAGERGTRLQLAGTIKEVVNKTPFSDLQLVKGTAEKITIDEYARNSQVLVDINTQVEEMNLDVATLVTGKGDIINLHIGADGCEVDILPESVEVRPGIAATVNDEVIGSADASELSSEPRLLAGYPGVTRVTPAQVEGLFSGNKPGTIYWAVSELADGSVSMEDLLSHPAYGGNIFENQAGSISASAKTEYGRQISSLVPGGSYYLSAVLVDGRENRSPLKVASFTTPDDTVPAFVGNPYMSKMTCETAQVTATANKDCLMFYAVLTQGAAAPTPQEFKTGSIGGNYGYGSVNMVKNVPVSINVNRSRLAEKTTYWLYLWLTDENGVRSMETPVRLEFTTPDETPPIVSIPIQTAVGESTAGITFSINEAPSTLYWAVVAEGDGTFISSSADMTSLRIKMKVESGTGAIASSGANGTAAAGANRETLFTITGLDTTKTGTNNYIMYYVAKDAAGNYSERVGSIHIRTLDTVHPRVTLEFTNVANNDQKQPLADTDIRLVFTEQVKGGPEPSTETTGTGPVTFLDYYNQVLASAGNPQTLQAARNAMAEELAKHIELYYCPATGSPYALTPRGSQDGDDDDWAIDWRNAVISMDSDGRVIITLPGSGLNPALQLDSGATYYFRFISVFDNAYKPNGLMDTDSGDWTMARFTTVYAQVDFWPNTGVSKITDSKDGLSDEIRLDIVVDVSPRATKKVPLTEYWDLIMWSDTVMRVDIYRQVVRRDDESVVVDQWERVREDVTFGYAGAGIGLSAELEPENFKRVNGTVDGGLDEDCIYRYGVHVKEMGTIEEDPTLKPDSWSALVTMRFSIIAGNSNDVYDVSVLVNHRTNANTNYNNSLREGKIKEIGTWTSPEDGPVNILRATRQFTDTKTPVFLGATPQFTPGSGSITMEVILDRPGTVYYVAAPVGTIFTSFIGPDGRSVEINTGNDGRDGLDTLTGRSYIPDGGDDIDGNEDFIHFISGGATDEERRYRSPGYLQIYNADVSGAEVRTGILSVEAGNTTTEATIPNLKSKTPYYVYIVLEGGGDPSKVVQIYRVDTLEAKAPSVTVRGNGSTATMTPSDDCVMTFVLVQRNALRGTIAEEYLDEMSTVYGEGVTAGPSVFDMTASTSLKRQMQEYISNRTDASIPRWELPKDTDAEHPFPNGFVPGNEGVSWDFNKNMDIPREDYVVIVMVRQVGASGMSGDDYGFGAFAGLRRRDDQPPTLLYAGTINEGFIPLVQTTAEETQATKNGVYYGTIDLLFDKSVYCYDRMDIYTLSYDLQDTDSRKNLLGALGGAGSAYVKAAKTGNIANEIMLRIEGMPKMVGGGIVFFNGDDSFLCNSDGYHAGTLILSFDPEIPASEMYKGSYLEGRLLPGFRVTWSNAPDSAG